MPWSDIPAPYRRAASLGGYALAAVLAGSEVVILALALNPNVNADYRAFYIDQTTTCLNRDATGSYTLGQMVSFRSDGAKRAASIKVCGWSGSAGDGTHSLGETSRLRVKIPPLRDSLMATLQMAAVIRPPQITQRVVISVNGVRVHAETLSGKEPRTVSFVVPPAALGKADTLEITFDYLDGIPPTPAASNIYKRSIKLVSLRLDAI
ncbi:hypothetical protein [Mesorhizobium sp.]|uniref:hypothetical protein n=1 Tax=Mesorhizobium sp. TaxID=1871066 RepID=UPI000FE8735B|nr:hypothetical protein [Mesorhizobium sp.]RWO48785.1 MAG: hypothetical protein EOS13_24400 [Mesorhizobium sp.]TIN23323.1 MAG: hypothetical protein E5Y19_27740 [Mesorhizobium sp.]TIN33237.1 MAG: hypothetical protein E5Y13_33290 [Mesorhizobium sp.]TJU76477.1 MAG: hypothetical protein E5Y15_28345 [Mesorhizobium sp.]TJU83881.1 MAG: hypothetical protein E5Y10_33305 [Mesorhizobium sp.]